jgi:hypothetical protein
MAERDEATVFQVPSMGEIMMGIIDGGKEA